MSEPITFNIFKWFQCPPTTNDIIRKQWKAVEPVMMLYKMSYHMIEMPALTTSKDWYPNIWFKYSPSTW